MNSINLELEDGDRQVVLLALHLLKLDRPGWTWKIGEIEKKLGGQLDWPQESSKAPLLPEEFRVLGDALQALNEFEKLRPLLTALAKTR